MIQHPKQVPFLQGSYNGISNIKIYSIAKKIGRMSGNAEVEREILDKKYNSKNYNFKEEMIHKLKHYCGMTEQQANEWYDLNV